MGPPEDKILAIDTVSQKTIKIMKFDVNFKKIGSMVLGVTHRWLLLETQFEVLASSIQ